MFSLTARPTLIDVFLPRTSTKTQAIIKDIVLILSFSIATAVCAKLKVEIGAVPITMQTLIVLLSGALLGSRRGALSQLTYLSMGLAGIPLFSRGGGLAYLLSPTFGYIIGFVFAAFFVGWLAEIKWEKKVFTAVLAMIIGNIFIYVFGLAWLARFVSFENVLQVGLHPFLLGDILKICLAALILPLAWKIIKR